MLIGLAGAALFYGDGMITPAISVLSAVEGLEPPNWTSVKLGSLHESALNVRHLGRSMNGLRAGMSAPLTAYPKR